MSERWIEAARRALGGALAERDAQSVEVERVVLDVRVGDQTEVVTVVLRGDELTAASTDAGRDMSSPFVRAALRFLAGTPDDTAADVRHSDPGGLAPGERRSFAPSIAPGERRSFAPSMAPGPVRMTHPPPPPSTPGGWQRGLAAALEDLATGLVRTGVERPGAPAVRDALERIEQTAPQPIATGLSRWLGRLERALAEEDTARVAGLLEGGVSLADALKMEEPTTSARQRLACWLGITSESEIERRVDRTYVEVARETLDGIGHGGVERRYLVDTVSLEVVREERGRGEAAPSMGPCPRVVHAGLSTVEVGVCAPERVHIHQYSVAIQVGPEELERVEAAAIKRAESLATLHRDALARQPALAEPFAIVAVGAQDEDDEDASSAARSDARRGELRDQKGTLIPMATGGEGVAEALAALLEDVTPRWIAGRLVERAGRVELLPCSLGTKDKIIRLR